MDSVFLLVRKLIEHGAQVWHFIMMLDRLRGNILSTLLVAVRAGDGGLADENVR